MARGSGTEIEGILYGATDPRSLHITPFTEDARRALADDDLDEIDQSILLNVQKLGAPVGDEDWTSYEELSREHETDISRYTMLDTLEHLVDQDFLTVESGGAGETNLRWRLTPLGKAACGLIAADLT